MREPSDRLGILLVGEGDFSFAANFCKKLVDTNLDVIVRATELRTADDLNSVYPDTFKKNMAVLGKMKFVSTSFEVDATELDRSDFFTKDRDWLVIWLAPYVPINTHKTVMHTPARKKHGRFISEFKQTVERVTQCDPRNVSEDPDQIARWSHQTRVLNDFFRCIENIKNKYQVNISVMLGIPLTSECVKRRFNFLKYSRSFVPQKIVDLNGLHQFRTTKGNVELDKIHRGTFKGVCFEEGAQNNTLFCDKVAELFDQCDMDLRDFSFDLSESPIKASPVLPKVTPSRYMGLFFSVNAEKSVASSEGKASCQRVLFDIGPPQLP